MRKQQLAVGLFLLATFSCSVFAQDAVFSPGFGTAGKGWTLIEDYTAEGYGARIASIPGGGFFVAGGSSVNGNNVAQIAILKADGTLDTSASNGGVIRTPLLNASFSLTADPNGTFLVGGGRSLEMVRFSASGAIDTNFGIAGAAGTKFGIGSNTTDGLAVDSSGRIVAVGSGNNGTPNDNADMIMARFTSAGQLDLTFNGTGRRAENFAVPGAISNVDFAKAVAIQPDGKIVVGGAGDNILSAGGTYQGGFHLLRYNSNGSRDGSFGQGGLAASVLGITDTDPYITTLKVLPDGKIFAAGYSSRTKLILAMYNPDGTLDEDFGSNGATVVDRFTPLKPNVVFQSNGFIRVVGVNNYIHDLLFDSHGQLLNYSKLTPPSLGDSIFGQEYYDSMVLDDGDILAVGKAAGWMLVSRFDRPIPHAPEPSSLLLVAVPLLIGLRRVHRSKI